MVEVEEGVSSLTNTATASSVPLIQLHRHARFQFSELPEGNLLQHSLGQLARSCPVVRLNRSREKEKKYNSIATFALMQASLLLLSG